MEVGDDLLHLLLHSEALTAKAVQHMILMLQDWLYEEGEDETKSTYVAKLNDLRQMGESHPL